MNRSTHLPKLDQSRAEQKFEQVKSWVRFVVLVLAFIGLWQVLLGAKSGTATLLHWLF